MNKPKPGTSAKYTLMGLLQRYIMYVNSLARVLENSKHSRTEEKQEENHHDDDDYYFICRKIKELPTDIK